MLKSDAKRLFGLLVMAANAGQWRTILFFLLGFPLLLGLLAKIRANREGEKISPFIYTIH